MTQTEALKLNQGDIIIDILTGHFDVVDKVTDEGVESIYWTDKIIPVENIAKVEGLPPKVIAYLHRRFCYPSFEAVGRAAWESRTDSAKAVGTTLKTVKAKLISAYRETV